MINTENKASKHKVWDRKETAYELTSKFGEGGQGMVCTTQFPNVLVKVSKRSNKDPRTIAWYKHLEWLIHQPLEGLKIARPKSLIVKPRFGYVMELMDGLEPLKTLLENSLIAVQEGRGLTSYQDTGGLSRRVRLLSRLARSMAALHGRALAYGDLSPSNVFVSKSHAYNEVWLIDCDNISVLSREGGQKVYTPDYGAPEILREESGINSLTDSWSFAVLAFQLLTLLHPLKGDIINDGEPELEYLALRGELPWIDHPSDKRNQTNNGLPREQMLTKRLRESFEVCFNAGLNNAEYRPSMAAWAETFEAAAMLLVECDANGGCGNSFLFNSMRKCPFCNYVQSAEHFLLMHHYVHAPLSDLSEGATQKDQWLRTGELQLVTMENKVELHSSPVGSSNYAESPVIARLELNKEGLWIEPTSSIPLSLQREKNQKIEKVKHRMLLKSEWKENSAIALHLGNVTELHNAWRCVW